MHNPVMMWHVRSLYAFSRQIDQNKLQLLTFTFLLISFRILSCAFNVSTVFACSAQRLDRLVLFPHIYTGYRFTSPHGSRVRYRKNDCRKGAVCRKVKRHDLVLRQNIATNCGILKGKFVFFFQKRISENLRARTQNKWFTYFGLI